MVLEQLLESRWIERRHIYSILLGFLYTLIGYGTSLIFFGKNVSIAILFITTLLLVPALVKLIGVEERRESSDGMKHFFYDHKEVIEIYLFLFIGVLIGYLFIGLIFSGSFSNIFSYQLDFLKHQEGLSEQLVTNFKGQPYSPTLSNFAGLLETNLGTTLIFFILSIFYGAGAVFLVMLNASIFSAFIIFVIQQFSRTFSHGLAILGTFLIHIIPEVAGFLLAAIAGGVISKALITEKFGSDGFRNVMKDSLVLLLIAFGVIIFSALLEVFVTTNIIYHIV